jgi:hypothetical protein
LLPYVEQQAAYDLFDPAVPAHGTTANYLGRTQQIPLYLCPSDPSRGMAIDEGPPAGITPVATG